MPDQKPKNTEPSHFDLIVVGASFAGLIAARTAAFRGLKVAVIDSKTEPGARVRTTGVLVKEASEEIDIPADLTRKIPGVRMYAPNKASIDLFAPGYYFLATDTPALMRWLSKEAERAGVTMMFGCRFTGGGLADDRIHIDGMGLTADYLLGADGAKSPVASAFGLGCNREFLIGLETEYAPYKGIDQDLLHCFVDSQLAPGYLGWIVPGVNMTQIGLAVSPTFFGEERKPDYNRFLSKIHPMFPGLLDLKENTRRSGIIPCGGLVSPLSNRRVLLTGDAAGLVSPLTAGGIRLAFQFGRRTGFAIANYLLDGGTDPGELMAREYPKFLRKTWLRRAWSFAPPNALLNRTLFTPPMRAIAKRIYFQKRAQIPGHLLPMSDPKSTPPAADVVL